MEITKRKKKKYKVINKKRKQRDLELKTFDIFHAEKKSTFLTSVILTIAFLGVNIWFMHILSSLCQKPKLLSSLYAILYTTNVLSHIQFHERNLEKIRMKSQPEKRLIQGDNIWNISFSVCFLNNIIDNNNNNNSSLLLFIPLPNVILEPGKSPNCDENIHDACNIYFNDVRLSNSNYLDIVCDEAIFRRLITYCEKKDNIRLILGQWHTSKDMCSALITIFSGYGIFILAANLGICYLDKLEKVDYQATCHILELIWIAIGITISKYLHSKNKKMEDIKNLNNNVLKAWYKICWAGYWFGHKVGIRRGNYDMQFKNLLAFSSLFPVAEKSNYAQSVTYFLFYVNDDETLQSLL
ncbi:hypothetical protein C1645_879557 [Glomus cerebriforme]|uniref:Uncharacterized protein n=1 Tax=Glomus cerebriforme TaxID=658196 RepID=A0A397SQD3_9GLOM|nr:hypothetical protein C1645_879557 [Glomus cerebriforme]